MFEGEGSESFFEQTLQYFKGKEAFAWNLQWGTYFTQTLEFPADLKMVPTVEWTQMVLQSVVMPEGGEVWSLFWHKGATISTTGLAFWRSDSHPQPRVR
mmetsp:Transcript_77520/g.171236  ORF Transcript_77520/g.171236 Transcript_77520/m.171236 type:complete len:99 (+) Transcript_77520:187-483(+)